MKQHGVLGVLALAMVPVALFAVIVVVVFGGGATSASACTPSAGVVDTAAISADANVAGFGHDQLVNAGLIANAAASMGLTGAGQTLGVQAAIGESSLVNIASGDGAINPDGSIADSIGLFQQQSSWGTVAQRMDPTTSATLFFQRLVTVTGWEALEPSIAINKVQINADPYHYTKYRDAASQIIASFTTLATGTPSTSTPSTSTALPAAGGCTVSGDAVALAQGLVSAMDAGTLTLLEARYADQIRGVAAGTATAQCGLDVRTLQLITLAITQFGTVGISDLNRQCTGSLAGAGTGSSHWINGGGEAVDFYSLAGAALTGGDPASMQLLTRLSQIAPDGTRAGQVECRTAVTLPHVTQFEDTCNHLHIDFAYTDGPLTLG
ncbi:hypothetical protein C5C18_11770 [Rathayibacter tritici]|uniref:hypothetical protein n=1 Tax=Rathayibacter tritici TaxID=33888 RepID=UPI000CE92CF4|nr:hypothetical protein [Rathayibacter tritici]PPF66178.1 hypothetical protein C5C21_09830 [Rathayibacter tritici]PPG05958.1 hypothetical protein C5C18_11770 [Rathayibacter tritici]